MGISFGAVQSTLTSILGMSKISARWVPRMLANDQKRVENAEQAMGAPWPTPPKIKRVHSAVKVMASIFRDN